MNTSLEKVYSVNKEPITYKILGCPCSPYDTEEEISTELVRLININKGGYSVAINAEKILKYSKNSELKEIINSASLCYPDGAGAVLGLKWLYGKRAQKLNFPIISLETAEREQWPVFILGTQEDINLNACDKIKNLFPAIQISGRANGFVSDEDKINLIKQSKPKLILIAMGTPRQEQFAKRLIDEGITAFSVGCGGALDILAGKTIRAPQFMIENNLEWFYRLYKEPSRWQRQLVLPVFVVKVLYEAFIRKIGARKDYS